MILPKSTLTLDFEGTSKDTTTGRIVQVAIHDESSGEMFTTLVDPSIPIPEESTEIHGITDEMVRGAPTFEQLMPEIERRLRRANVIVTFNGNRYDLQLLQEEFEPYPGGLSYTEYYSL